MIASSGSSSGRERQARSGGRGARPTARRRRAPRVRRRRRRGRREPAARGARRRASWRRGCAYLCQDGGGRRAIPVVAEEPSGTRRSSVLRVWRTSGTIRARRRWSRAPGASASSSAASCWPTASTRCACSRRAIRRPIYVPPQHVHGWSRAVHARPGASSRAPRATSTPRPASARWRGRTRSRRRGYEALRDYVSFYPGRVDHAWLDDELVVAQEGGFYGGWITADIAGPFKGAPGTLGW